MISIYFYAIWTIIGVLIILTIITLLILVLALSKKFYKLTKLVYDEQQEILGKINEALNPTPSNQPEAPDEVDENEGKNSEETETETE